MLSDDEFMEELSDLRRLVVSDSRTFADEYAVKIMCMAFPMLFPYGRYANQSQIVGCLALV